VEFLSPAPTRPPMKTVWKVVFLQDVAKEFGASTTFYVYPALSLTLSTGISHVYILPVLRSLYCNNMHGEAIMDKFYKIRCVSFMLLHWSPIVEIFINPPLQSIDLIIQAITTTSLHEEDKMCLSAPHRLTERSQHEPDKNNN
jgi:hypothetical protein